MKLVPGKYFIAEHSYWSNTYYNFLIIECINKDFNIVNYKYTEEDKLRERTFEEFRNMNLIPASTLIEELF